MVDIWIGNCFLTCSLWSIILCFENCYKNKVIFYYSDSFIRWYNKHFYTCTTVLHFFKHYFSCLQKYKLSHPALNSLPAPHYSAHEQWFRLTRNTLCFHHSVKLHVWQVQTVCKQHDRGNRLPAEEACRQQGLRHRQDGCGGPPELQQPGLQCWPAGAFWL